MGFGLRLGFGPQDWDLGLKARIWASRLRYGPGGWGAGTKKEEKEEKEKEKIPLCEKRANLRPEKCLKSGQIRSI